MEPYQIDQTIRLQKLIKALNVNQSAFAKSIGMAQPNISKIISGKGQVSTEVLNRISNVYEQINLHWLMTGKGEMFLGEEEKKIPEVNEPEGVYDKGKSELEERVEWLEETLKKVMVILDVKP